MSVAERLPASPTVTALAVAGLFVLVLPFTGLLSEYYVGIVASVMVLGMFAMSFNLLFGYTGLLSFGHAAYFGIGSYVFGLALSGRLEFLPGAFESFFPALVLAVVSAAVAGLVIGFLCVQRGDIYFAILTLAFSMMIYESALSWNDLTGGQDGLTLLVEPVELGGLTLNMLDTGTFYYVSLLCLAVVLAALWRIIHSPYGELLISIRENPERAAMIGLPVKRYQLSSFVIAATIAGLSGTLFVIRNFIVTPQNLHWSVSAEPVMMTLLGGPSAFLGPLIGAVMFVGLEEVLTNVTQHWHVGLGALLILIVLFVPGGVAGLLRGDTGELDRLDPRTYLGNASGPTTEEDVHE